MPTNAPISSPLPDATAYGAPSQNDLETYAVCHEDVRLHVTACGQGLPIVLLPSLGRDVEDFHGIALRLAERGWRVLMPSPRGIGGSTGPTRGITLHDLARDIAEVIRQAQAGPAVVAGHAFGNWVARMTATDHPAQVLGVALLAAAHKNFPGALRAHIDGSMNTRLPRAERLAHLHTGFFAAHSDPSVWLDGWHAEAALAQRAASAATPVAAWWPAGQAPLLDVQAQHDVFAPRSAADALRKELGARVSIAVVADAGHALLPEQPAAVAALLDQFAHQLHASPGPIASPSTVPISPV